MPRIITKTPKDTRRIGLKLAKNLKKGDILALVGNLGSGKTTLIKGLAMGLGIKKNIRSPSFILLRSYKLNKGKFKYFYHFDLYRLKSIRQLEYMGLEEYLKNRNGTLAIEWADKILKNLPRKIKLIKFKYIDKNTREIIY